MMAAKIKGTKIRYRWSKPPIEIVREYFPDASDDHAGFILWNKTGWPGFWHGDPEKCLRRQLDTYRRAVKLGRDICYCHGKIRWPSQMDFEMCKRGTVELRKLAEPKEQPVDERGEKKKKEG